MVSSRKPLFRIWSVAAVLAAVGGGCAPQIIAGTQATPTQESVLAPTPTRTVIITPTVTSTLPLITLTAGPFSICYLGPDAFLYGEGDVIAEGEWITILARATEEWPGYFYVSPANGSNCWMFVDSLTLRGNIDSLPEMEAPPLPKVMLTIENKMYLPITGLFIRAQGDTTWGNDRLGGNRIDIGAAYQFPITAGYYDLQIRDEYGGILREEWGRPITEWETSRTLRIESRFTVVIRNESSISLCRISADSGFGPKMNLTIVGNGIVAPGKDTEIEAIGGHYDLVLHRCMDDVARFVIASKYIGPLSTMIILSDRIALP